MNRWMFRRGVCIFVMFSLLLLTSCDANRGEPVPEKDTTASVTDTTLLATTTTVMSTSAEVTTSHATEGDVSTMEPTTATSVTTTVSSVHSAVAPVVTKTTTTTSKTTTTATVATTAKPQKQWELFWSDEFDGDTLDTSKWNIELGSTSAVVKKEANVSVKDGNCVLTLRRDHPKDGYEYSSAYVTTADKFSFCYGRLEFRARLPVGQGVWPALWTLGDYYLTTTDELGWPLGGEIDVMEMVGSSTYVLANQKIMGTLHWGPNRDAHEQAHSAFFLPDNADADYHIYAVEWDENEMVWFVDDTEYMRVKLNDPDMGTTFMQKHWLIMNINLCDWGNDCFNDTTPDTASMYVDYVRVYKEKK